MPKPVIDVSNEWNKIQQLGDGLREMQYDRFAPKSKADIETYKFLIGRSERRIDNMAKDFLRNKGFTTTGKDRKTGTPSMFFVEQSKPAPKSVETPAPAVQKQNPEADAIKVQIEKLKKLLGK